MNTRAHPWFRNWMTSLAGIGGSIFILATEDVHNPATWGKALSALFGGLSASDGWAK